jgi:hypothetical protein
MGASGWALGSPDRAAGALCNANLGGVVGVPIGCRSDPDAGPAAQAILPGPQTGAEFRRRLDLVEAILVNSHRDPRVADRAARSFG